MRFAAIVLSATLLARANGARVYGVGRTGLSGRAFPIPEGGRVARRPERPASRKRQEATPSPKRREAEAP